MEGGAPQEPDVRELTEDERQRYREMRLREAEERERSAPIQTWWVSFADEDGFLGVAIVRARGIIDAIRVCRERKCGTEGRGSVRAEPVDEEIDERWFYRLLTEEEVERLRAELDGETS